MAANISTAAMVEKPIPGLASFAARLAPSIILTVAWVAMAVVADPVGDFSLNDDWAFGLPVKVPVENRAIRFTFWQSMTLIAQVFWGTLFCLPRGFSFNALRFSSLAAGLIGILGLHGFLRHNRAGSLVALIGAIVLVVNPLYFGLSCTFMTDAPFTALMIVSIALLCLGLDTGRDREIWIGLAIAFAALFVRQLALAIFLGFVVASPLRLGFGRRWLILAVLPTLAAFASLSIYARVLHAFGRLPRMYFDNGESLMHVLSDLAHLHVGALRPMLSAAIVMIMLTGLFEMPLLALVAPTLLARGSRAARKGRLAWLIVFTISATTAFAVTGNLIPMTGNVFYEFKMGPLSLPGDAPPGPPKAFWIGVTAFAATGVSLLLLVLFDLVASMVATRRDFGASGRRFQTVFLVATSVFYLGAVGLPYAFKFDRYVIPILGLFPSLVVLIPEIELKRPSRLALATSLLITAAFAAYSVVTVHDYFAWNREGWASCHDLMEGRLEDKKVASDDIDGGFEFNNQMANERGIYTAGAAGYLVKNAERRRYAIAFRELPGFTVMEHRACRTWLPYSPREIWVLGRTDSAP
jgi:hypothetical protein